MLLAAVAVTAASTTLGAIAPVVLTPAQDSAVTWVSGQSLGKFYPLALRKRHVEGVITCRMTIDASGRVTNAVAVHPNNPRLALVAVRAVKTFRFNNTLSRPVIKVMAVRFKLADPPPSAQVSP